MVLCGILLIINPIIVGVVLKSLKYTIYKPGIGRAMFIKIAALGLLFEAAITTRMIVVYF